jgi:hypothetical protein
MADLPIISPHRHNDVDSPKLYLGDAVLDAPKEALTTASSPATLTTGGSNDLKTVDAVILQNLLTRFAEMEDKLQELGLLK